ncbi:hypothetical protein [Hyphomicrobium sulfonivorans]|uniref:hypothetical protein n=2 Tax=Hyphomicrobium sulfonivorans TaxID=121290 RepID=UPI001AEE2B76|nr:hypothetical protein [Hyphomicrobium sulfonivorans]
MSEMKNENTAPSEPTSIPTLLSVVSDELNFLATDVERLHDIVELPGVRDSLRQAQCFNVLQGIDHITQNLAGLADFLKTVAESAPPAWQIDTRAACDVVLLASLCERLKQPSQPRKVHAGGDECEFF